MKQKIKRVFWSFVIVLPPLFAWRFYSEAKVSQGMVFELHESALPPCSASPNCVSSMDSRPEFAIAGIEFSGSIEVGQKKITAAVLAEGGVLKHSASTGYVHAEFISQLFGFVDDVEFLHNTQTRMIELRSASRVGKYDFGENRKRIERLRQRFAIAQ